MTAVLPPSWLCDGKKYGRFRVAAKADRTLDGRVFDSKREMQRWAILEQRERAGLIRDLKFQPEFKCYVNGKLLCVYHADNSYVDTATEIQVIEDVKGTGKGGTGGDAAFKLRKKAAELQYGITITVISK